MARLAAALAARRRIPPNGFAPTGQPNNVVFYAGPFREAELLALAKAYQDAAGFHLQRPGESLIANP